jgi:hypothetical protein
MRQAEESPWIWNVVLEWLSKRNGGGEADLRRSLSPVGAEDGSHHVGDLTECRVGANGGKDRSHVRLPPPVGLDVAQSGADFAAGLSILPGKEGAGVPFTSSTSFLPAGRRPCGVDDRDAPAGEPIG